MTKLDSGLKQFVGYRIRRAAIPIMAHVNESLMQFGLRRVSFSALEIIRGNPGLQQAHLAEALAVENSNLVQIVDDLESKGFVERRKCDTDRRANALFVTELGTIKLQECIDKLHELESSFCDGLDPSEIELLHGMLERIRSSAEALQKEYIE